MPDTKKAENPKALAEGIVMPVVTPEQAKASWDQYQQLKNQILQPSDIQKIQGKDFKKKSYWRKLATFFNISVKVIEERSEKIGSTLAWHYTVRATAPNGRYTDGAGSCDIYEKARFNGKGYVDSNGNVAVPNNIHNIRSTAYTRAYNRAVSDMVGGGEVSAEEVDQENQKK